MLIKELERLIQQIEIKHKKKLYTNRSGSIYTNKTGRGLDFKEVRSYVYGDDTRLIDWNVSSRLAELYVKEYYEENDRLVNLFFDVSSSMLEQGVNEYSKFFVGFQFLAFLTLLSVFLGDRVKIVLYSDKIERISEEIKTRNSAYKLLKKINEISLENKQTDHLLPFMFLKNRFVRKSSSYIISDFANLPQLEKFRPIMEMHELYAVRIYDITETLGNEPIFKSFFVQNSETGVGDNSYNSSFEKDSNVLDQFFRYNLLNLRTDSELGKNILKFLNT